MQPRLRSVPKYPEWLSKARGLRESGWLLRQIAIVCETSTGNVDYWLNHEERLEAKSQNLKPFVYFVQADWGGPIKIGFGTAQRVANLRVASPDELVVRLRVPCTSRKDAVEHEKFLHKRFAWCRIRGEWYRPEFELAQLCKAKMNMSRWDEYDYPTVEQQMERKLTGRILREAHEKGRIEGHKAGYAEGFEDAKADEGIKRPQELIGIDRAEKERRIA